MSTLDFKHSELTRQKMINAKRPPLTEEHKQKIANSNRGSKRSEETKRILSEKALQRKPASLETRMKISIGNKGKTQTDSAKEKIRISSTGRLHTEESKRKISETRIKKFSKLK